MEIRIQPIHFELSQQLEAFIQKKTSKLEQYHEGIQSADVVLKVIKPETANNKDVSVKLNVPNQDFFATKTADSFEEALDHVVEALEKQVLKFKEKQRTK
ncbi:RNA polymerase subunit sigma-54 [Bacteroidales bacterium]|nr:RNA polymerase subunit sigma-54 [Bacteroidales bacterium]